MKTPAFKNICVKSGKVICDPSKKAAKVGRTRFNIIPMAIIATRITKVG